MRNRKRKQIKYKDKSGRPNKRIRRWGVGGTEGRNDGQKKAAAKPECPPGPRDTRQRRDRWWDADNDGLSLSGGRDRWLGWAWRRSPGSDKNVPVRAQRPISRCRDRPRRGRAEGCGGEGESPVAIATELTVGVRGSPGPRRSSRGTCRSARSPTRRSRSRTAGRGRRSGHTGRSCSNGGRSRCTRRSGCRSCRAPRAARVGPCWPRPAALEGSKSRSTYAL